MARLPDAFIDDLLARTDLVEVIGARVPLKRQGREYSARCPFHDERSPSFTVRRSSSSTTASVAARTAPRSAS
jgi:DNA primase